MVQRERDSEGKFVHLERISVEELKDLYVNKMVPGTEIARRLGVSPTAVFAWLRKAGVDVKKHMPKITPNLSPSEELAYVLGVLKSDGSVGRYGRGNYRITLLSTSEVFNKSFEDALQRLGLHAYTKKSSLKKEWGHWGHKPMYQTVAHSKVFYDWYENLTTEQIEKMLVEHGLQHAFLRGFYEGDGSLKSRGDLAISNSDEEMLNMVARLITDCGIEVRVGGPFFFTHSRNRKPMFLIQMGEKKAKKLLDLIKPCIKA